MKNKFFIEENSYVFTSCYKENINIHDGDTKENNESVHVEVTEYAPRVFKRIREIEGITEDEITESLNPHKNANIIQSQGKSSSFFISTHDSKLIVKTLKKEEFDIIFNRFLIFYVNYIENRRDSLICRIYGIFKVTASIDCDPFLIIVMRDAYGPLKGFISRTYDLKGSLHGRETEITEDNINDSFLARKDLNFLNEEKVLRIDNRNKFLENISKDAEFFEDFNLMDYSLLLLKLNFKNNNNDYTNDFLKFKETRDFDFYSRHIYKSKDDPNTFYVCFIIDFFQEYNLRKKMENNLKNLITEKNDLISCVPSDQYSSRFIEFITLNSE